MSPDPPGTESFLNVVLTEFQAIREEILATVSMQYTILSLGTGLLAGLFGVALSQSSNPASDYLLLLVPFVSVSISALWAVEGIRRLRASSYVRDELAPTVEAIFRNLHNSGQVPGGKLLGYESFLRDSKSEDMKKWNNSFYRLLQIGILGILTGSGFAAWVLALYLIVWLQGPSLPDAALFFVSVALILEVLAMGYVGFFVSSVVRAARTLLGVPRREVTKKD